MEFKVWKTIKLGTGLHTADDFKYALKEGGFHFSLWTEDIFNKSAFTVATKETEADLVVVSGSDLGFNDRTTREEIYKRALELGLELCPPEVGPQLRIQYKDQPVGEQLLIGMKPIISSVGGGGPGVFGVDCLVGGSGSGRWLFGFYGGLEYSWDVHHRWVFLRPKPN